MDSKTDNIIRKENTIRRAVKLVDGDVTLTLCPAKPHHGIVLQRVDHPNKPLLALKTSRLIATEAGLGLRQDGVEVLAIEALLVALWLLEIDNVLVQVNAVKIPTLPEGAIGFMSELRTAGIVRERDDKVAFQMPVEVTHKDSKTHAELTILPANDFQVDTYWSREEMGQVAHTTWRSGTQGLSQDIVMLLATLMSLKMPLKGRVLACNPNPQAVVSFAKKIDTFLNDWAPNKARVYLPSLPSVMSTEEIDYYLPQRYPFTFIDKVLYISDELAIGLKNLTRNEAYFQGHFPDMPVMPGVLQVEAMAQLAGIFSIRYMRGDPKDYDPFFVSIKDFRFRKVVVPGDALLIKCAFTKLPGAQVMRRKTFAYLQCEGYLGQDLVCEGKIVIVFIKKADAN